MTPTPELLAELAARILAIMPRTRGQALDGAAVEVGMLLGELCETPEAADHLAGKLVAHPWRRWNFSEFSTVARSLAALRKPFDPITAATLKSQLVPDLFSDAEYEALYRRALHAGLKIPTLNIPDVVAAEDAARKEATAWFDAMGPRKHKKLMSECRAEYTARIKSSWPDGRYDRTTEPPYLDRNARDVAERRIYRHLVLDEPLYFPPTETPAPAAAGPSDPLGQKTLRDLAQKKRL